MYTQAMDIPQPVDDAKLAETPDRAGYQAQFDAMLARGDFIEAKDWMPEAYRRTLVRQISQHAHSEDRKSVV